MTSTNDGHSEDMDKWRIIESELRMTQGLERLRHIKMWSFQDAREFVTVAIWRQDQAELFLAMLNDAERMEWASPYLGIKDLEDKLRLEMMNSFHVVDHAGGITGLGSMVFSPDLGYHTWKLYDRNAPSILVANLVHRGNFCRTAGVPGSGKTNLGCVISEEYVKLPNHFAIGNIRMMKPDPRFIYAKDARSLFVAISNLPDDSFWLFNHDEGGLSYAKPDQATRRVKDLDKLMFCIRKLGGSYNLIEQREDSVPKVIMDFAKNIFYCESRGIVSIEMRGPELAFRDTVKDFPKTSLPFDTNDIAMFDINIDVQRLFSFISGRDDAKQAMKEFLNIEDQPKKEYLEKVCAFPGCGRSLVGMHPNARYCSNNVYPFHAQEDAKRRKAYDREPIKEEEKKRETESLEEFLK